MLKCICPIRSYPSWLYSKVFGSNTWLTSYLLPSAPNTFEEKKIGNLLASNVFVQYEIGMGILTITTYPTNTLVMAKPGVANWLPRNATTADQLRPNDPIPRLWAPEPICCIVMESFQIQQMEGEGSDGREEAAGGNVVCTRWRLWGRIGALFPLVSSLRRALPCISHRLKMRKICTIITCFMIS